MPRRPRHLPGGFTLIDLLVTLTVMVILAAIVLPAFNGAATINLVATTRVLSSDIEMAQAMTIASPDDPVVVRFDAANQQYWLARASDPETPILHEDTQQEYRVVFGQRPLAAAAGTIISLTDIADEKLVFNGQGGVADLTTEPKITLLRGGRWIRLEISPTTGTITEVSGTG